MPVGPRTFFWLVLIASCLVTISGVLYVLIVLNDSEQSWGRRLHPLFDVATEFNVPTWYSSALWLLLALVSIAVAVHGRRRASWVALAVVASYASLDEFAMLHERWGTLGGSLGQHLPVDVFSYRWVIVGVLAAAVVALLMAPLVLSLPRRIMVGFIVAGATFLTGAVVVETIGGFVERHYGQVTWHLMLLIHIEEWLEMVGVALAVACAAAMIHVVRTPTGLATRYAGNGRRAPRTAESSQPASSGSE